MALTQRPEEWHFVVSLPESRENQLVISQDWTLEVKEPLSCGWQEFPFTKPLNIRTETRRTGSGAEVRIIIESEVSAQCRRCLCDLTVAIQEEFMYSYVLQTESSEKAEEEEEFYDSDKVVVPVAHLGSSLDISDCVWECLVVSLPAYAECPDGCAEVETYVPAEDRVDPRFLALADLIDKEEKGGK